jgi:anti-sigma factor RsiW
MRLPDVVQTDDRCAREFAKPSRQSSLAAASATQDDDSCHDCWLPQEIRERQYAQPVLGLCIASLDFAVIWFRTSQRSL